MLIAPAINATLITELSRVALLFRLVQFVELFRRNFPSFSRMFIKNPDEKSKQIPFHHHHHHEPSTRDSFIFFFSFHQILMLAQRRHRRCFRRLLCWCSLQNECSLDESSGCQFSLLLLVFVYILHFHPQHAHQSASATKIKDFPE